MRKRSGAAAHDVEFRRLFVIAKAILNGDPTIDNFEWCERIKDELIRTKLGYPENPMGIHDAMRAVEAVVPRPAPQLPTMAPITIPHAEPKEPPTPEGLALRDAIQAKLDAIVKGKAMPGAAYVAPGTTEAQINAYRRELLAKREPTHRKTARGWAPIHREDHREPDDEPPDRDV